MVLVAALVVACTTAGSSSPSVSPAATGSASPAAPSAAVTPSPSASGPAPSTPEPTPASSPGATYHGELQTANGRPVSVAVTDESGRLAGATSGVPGDGASVAMGVVELANDDPSTLRLTWAGPPCANDLVVVINASTTVITWSNRNASAIRSPSIVSSCSPSTGPCPPTLLMPSSRPGATPRPDDVGVRPAPGPRAAGSRSAPSRPGRSR